MDIEELEKSLKAGLKALEQMKEMQQKPKKNKSKPMSKPKQQEKNEPEYPEKTRPYQDKVKILKTMPIDDKISWIPKERFQGNDYVFPLDIHDMVEFFNINGIQGRKWIKYDEQIDYIALPLMKAYKLPKERQKERLNLMKGQLKGKVVKYRYDMKNANDKAKRVLNSKARALESVITKIDGLL